MKNGKPGAARPMFHVVNGDSTLALLHKAAVPGEFMVWPDMLMEGPLIRKPDGKVDASSRATFLSRNYGVPREKVAARLRAFDKAVDRAARSDGEVTLWFEEDFFCQIHLVYLLATLHPSLRKPGRVSIVCPARPLGSMPPKALERLFAARTPADSKRMALSRKVWNALSAPGGKAPVKKGAAGRMVSGAKARALADSADGFSSWPLLRRGLRAQLDRRPENGQPGTVEKAVAKALKAAGGKGGLGFGDLYFRLAQDRSMRPLGMGDAQVARELLALASRGNPPILLKGAGSRPMPGKPLVFQEWTVHPAG